jgi:hypothetical protein
MMTWFAASIVMYVRFKDGDQDKYPVWENVVLIAAGTAEEALEEANRLGAAQEAVRDASMRWEDRAAEWVFGGVRKILTVSNPTDIANSPDHGAEITYSEFELSDRAALDDLVSGGPVTVKYVE